jgi:hypothetical protein
LSPSTLVPLNSSRRSGGAACRHFGASFVSCGVIAALYHGCPPGAARRLLRKLDYWSICYTSSVLRGAVGARAPRALGAAAALATPLKPTLVIGCNLLAIEARFVAAAVRHAALRGALCRHAAAAAAGVAAFLMDDILVLEKGFAPVFHPAWVSRQKRGYGRAVGLVTLGRRAPARAA